jgi:hypothetical protein
MKHHLFCVKILTPRPEAGRGTMAAGQFDWGGFLPKSNGGVVRFPQLGWQSSVEHMGRWELNCETHTSNRYESSTK